MAPGSTDDAARDSVACYLAAPKRCNCFWWSLRLFWKRGGYWACRRSRHIWGLHWMWSIDARRWFHYEPIAPKNLPQAIWHKLWYRGRVKEGDD